MTGQTWDMPPIDVPKRTHVTETLDGARIEVAVDVQRPGQAQVTHDVTIRWADVPLALDGIAGYRVLPRGNTSSHCSAPAIPVTGVVTATGDDAAVANWGITKTYTHTQPLHHLHIHPDRTGMVEFVYCSPGHAWQPFVWLDEATAADLSFTLGVLAAGHQSDSA